MHGWLVVHHCRHQQAQLGYLTKDQFALLGFMCIMVEPEYSE